MKYYCEFVGEARSRPDLEEWFATILNLDNDHESAAENFIEYTLEMMGPDQLPEECAWEGEMAIIVIDDEGVKKIFKAEVEKVTRHDIELDEINENGDCI